MWEDNELIVDEIDDVLEHHGIKGQKWGQRRYQNPDGSLTALGKKRLAKGEVKVDKPKRKSVKEMNASELRAEIERRALATKLSEVDQKKTKIGRFIQKMSSKNKSADDLRVEIEKQELKNELKQIGKKPKEEVPKKEEPKNRHELTKRDLKDLNDTELNDAIERAALEQKFRQLHPEEKSFLQKTAEKFRDKVADATIDATVNLGKEYLMDRGKKALGLTDAELENLKNEAAKVGYRDTINTFNSKVANNYYDSDIKAKVSGFKDTIDSNKAKADNKYYDAKIKSETAEYNTKDSDYYNWKSKSDVAGYREKVNEEAARTKYDIDGTYYDHKVKTDISKFKADADKQKAEADKKAANARQEEEKAKQAEINTQNQKEKQKTVKQKELIDRQDARSKQSEARVNSIISKFNAGQSVNEIAAKMNISESKIYDILNKLTKPD